MPSRRRRSNADISAADGAGDGGAPETSGLRPGVASAADEKRPRVCNLIGRMAVRIRLRRIGSSKNPIWRIVVADKRSPRDGRTIETIGRYNPQTEPSLIELDEERTRHWLERGAQPSRTVAGLMRAKGIDARGS